MADARLSVEVEAKIDDFQSKMAQVQAGVKQTATVAGAAVTNMEKSFFVAGQQITGVSAKVQAQLDKFRNIQPIPPIITPPVIANIEKAGQVLGGSLVKGSNSAAFALTNLGRVAQDAPYGFIGIQNNLNPLLESFQRLKVETGGTGAALKALGGSLIGPAGLGIALSLISAAFLLYQQYAQKATKETKELADASEALGESAAKEIAKLSILYDASQNLNIPLAERKKIVDELQEQFPTTFGNLTDEAILAGKAQSAYEGLTQSLINAAVVRGGEDLIAAKVKGLAQTLIAFQEEARKYSDATKGKGLLAKNSFWNVDENGDMETLIDYEARLKKEIKDVRDSVQKAIGGFSAQDIIGNFGEPTKDKKDTKRETVLPWIQNYKNALNNFKGDLQGFTKFVPTLFQTVDKSILTALGDKTDVIVSTLATPFEIFKDDVVYDLLPKLGSAFDNFFTNILETGKFSFAALGQAIIKSFASVLASDATTTLLGMLGNKEAKGKDTIFKSIAGLFGGGAGGAAATGGGFLATALPIAGIAAGAFAIGSALFKKRDRTPDPVYTNNGVSTPSSGSQGNSVIHVIMTARGRDLVGTLNLEGFYLSRVQNGRG